MENGNLITDSKKRLISWHDRIKKKSNIVIILSVVLILIFAAILFYLLFSVKIRICTSPTCVRNSMELLQYINPKANPCDDFYKFSCDTFLQNTNLEKNRASKSVSDATQDEILVKIRNMLEQPVQEEDRPAFIKAKTFFKACVNEALANKDLNLMKDIFRTIGGFPTLEGTKWNSSQFDLVDAIVKLRKTGINADFFFTVTVDEDVQHESQYILGIHDLWLQPSDVEIKLKNIFLEYMIDLVGIFGAKRDLARRDCEGVIQLMLKLRKISEESANLNKTGLYDVFSISELEFAYPLIQWFTFLKDMLFPAASITYDDTVVVSEPRYIKKLMTLLQETPKRILANFVAWQSLQRVLYFLPGKALDTVYKFNERMFGIFSREPRWITCIKATRELMDPVLSAAYVEYFFDYDSRRDASNMILNIKDQFKSMLKTLYWIDKKSKNVIIEELLKNVEDIGYPNELQELHFENEVYNDAEVYEDQLLLSALNLDVIRMNLEYSKLRKLVRINWLSKSRFVTGLEAQYSPKERRLRFPVGIFSGIYYQVDRPKYMNYGALGSVVAHEISHVFIKARDRDLSGDARSRWSLESLLRYEERLECLAEQYGRFQIGELNQNLDSQKTREEDMADLAGMKIAYYAYSHWFAENGGEPRLPGLNYTANQLFWISAAVRQCTKFSPQVIGRYLRHSNFSPPRFRVNGPLQNLDEFAYDFGCPIGSNMNPEKKCYVW